MLQDDLALIEPKKVNVDGIETREGIRLIGTATEQFAPDTYRCLADVRGALCLIEVRLRAKT